MSNRVRSDLPLAVAAVQFASALLRQFPAGSQGKSHVDEIVRIELGIGTTTACWKVCYRICASKAMISIRRGRSS
jgi:hypothetical protein